MAKEKMNSGMLDVLDLGCWISWMLDFGYWILDAGLVLT